jgi:hypothetical protein
MKVAINACFGGFGLSTEAMKLLVARGSAAVKVQSLHDYTGGRMELMAVEHSPLVDVGDGFQAQTFLPDVLHRDGMVYTFEADYEERSERTDPHVIAVIEDLGARANGNCADLRVIEIPDGVEWEIDEYDGREHVAERHRTWWPQ